MSERNDSREIKRSLNELNALEQVPPAVSRRYHETLNSLAAGSQIAPKRNAFQPSTWQFSLAASFLLVFAGAAIFLSNSDPASPLNEYKSQSSKANSESPSTQVDDQLLFSGDEAQQPAVSTDKVFVTNSSLNYGEIDSSFTKKLEVGNTYNDSSNVGSDLLKCLDSLELGKITNLIDTGMLNQKEVQAIWSPVSKSTWYVYILDMNCQAIDKLFVRK
jgi:hypothetical protein